MELKKAQHSSHRIQFGLSLGLLLACSQFSSPVMADEFVCDAVQSSNKALAKLESSCPIGKGVWGKKVPQKGNDFYWIQCGLFPKPMSPAKAKPIYRKITTDVWMKPGPNGYRCLIGPYFDANKAAVELRGVKTLSSYKEAFIRAVGEGSAKSVNKTNVQAKPAVSPKPVTPVRVMPKSTATEKAAIAKPAPKSESTPLLTGNDAISVRLKASLQGKTFVVPYLVENRNQFYMEHGTPWNRLNYADSAQLCEQLSMSLASSEEFKLLTDSGVMKKDRWPMQLPYWGKDKIGLFADREPNQLDGKSLLNVMCVK